MKKLISTIAIATVLCAPSFVRAEAENDPGVAQQLEELQNKLKTQQQEIEAISSQVAGSGGGGFKLGNKMTDSLTLKGDLRVRYERRAVDNPGDADDPARDRLRTRFRVGLLWDNKAENLQIGAGLATGGSDGTSTNATWSESNFFETGDIRLDYAYAKHKLGDFTLIAGQHPKPYTSSWVLWDSDLRPAGFTAQFQHGIFVATVGGYEVYQAGDDVAMMISGQGGLKGKMGRGKYDVAVAYYNFDSKVFDKISRPNPDYKYKIGDLYASMEMPLGPVTGSLYGDVFNNFGAKGEVGQGVYGGNLDPEKENLGWVVGLGAKIDKFKLKYCYAVVGADSVIGLLKDADFGTGVNSTDLKGSRVDFSYAVTKDFSAGITFMDYKAKELSDKPKAQLYQVDLNYKF